MEQENLTHTSPLDQPVDSKVAHVKKWLSYQNHQFQITGSGGLVLLGLALLLWINSGIYKVQPDEQGVVLRFGKYVETVEPGLHYHFPAPFETALMPKVTQINQIHLGVARSTDNSNGGTGDAHDRQMLTGDENIVEAECTVFWRIKDAKQYLFRVSDPEASVRISAESALREIIGRTPIQAAMSDKRQQIADETKELLQRLLDKEMAGILIQQVQLQRVDPPPAVIDAFNDVQRARADQERARNDAESYTNDVLPRARGEASKTLQDAEAYRAQVRSLAEGDAKSFLSMFASYQKSKDVTAWRMYLESVDEVLRKASKVIVDSSGKGTAQLMPHMAITDGTKPVTKDGSK